MSAPTLEKPAAVSKEEQPLAAPEKRFKTRHALLIVLVIWVAGWTFLHGRQTLALDEAELNGFHLWLNGVRDSFDNSRGQGFGFAIIGGISKFLNLVFGSLQDLFARPASPRPVPEIGWLGATALAVWVALALAGARSTILVLVSFLTFGLFGFWSQSWDTLIVTAMAVVFCILIGVPVGIWMARSKAVSATITPILDIMQTMPSFAYLTPLVLIFGIGAASAIVLTMVYAIPPLIRITEHGIRGVAASTVEASRSLGLSSNQLLRQVQLPMARSTIIVGINQCTMAALSMATIAALVDGPGLGKPVVSALQSLDIGTAFTAGFSIVMIAIMLDRTTSRASQRAEIATRTGADPQRRRIMLAVVGVVALILVYLSRTYLWAARFPDTGIGRRVGDAVSTFNAAAVDALAPLTNASKDAVSLGLLNPLQALMADTPWWLMAGVILAVAFILGGWKAAAISAVCEAVILGTGLWNQSMVTLTMALVATILVMVIAVSFGVWMGRNKRADAAIRPILDGFQTIPAFVYLVPALALFASSRFTAIVAAMAYAVPIATKLVADGIRGVSPTTVEAAQSIGSTVYQMIAKVQVPMARSAVVLAANQGLLYVLSMVVIGGMVGGGGLGYLVVAGFVQGQMFGKGLAAGIAITALGIMVDRITQYAAARYGRA